MSHRERVRALRGIEADELVLQPFRFEWAEDVLAACRESEDELRRFVPWLNTSLGDVRSFIDRAHAAQQAGDELHMAVLRRTDDRFLGAVGLHRIGQFTPRAEVGYWIRTSENGRRYATRALATLVHHAEQELGIMRLNASAAESNVPSQRALARCHFQREGFRPQGELCHGVWHDLILFGHVAGRDASPIAG